MRAARGRRWVFWLSLASGLVAVGVVWHLALPEAPRSGKLYVADPFDDRLRVFDLGTGAQVRDVKVGRLPHQLAIAPGRKLWVAEAGSQSVSLVDTRTDRVVMQRMVGRPPDNAAHRKQGLSAVAQASSCQACHGMRVVGSLPAGLALGKDGQDLWVTETQGRRVSRLDPGDLATRDQLAMLGNELTPSQVLVNPLTGDLYVVARTYRGDMPTGPTGPTLSIAADPEHAAAQGTSAITAFDPALGNVKSRVELPYAGAYTGVFSGDGKRLYVACRGADRIVVLETSPLKVVKAYATAPGPAGLALTDPQTLVVAAFNTSPGIVQFLDRDTGQVRQILRVPPNPAALAVHPRTGEIYVGCAGADVLELDAKKREVKRSIAVGAHASALVVLD